MSNASREPKRTVRQLLDYGVRLFEKSRISYGHGTLNALDEAAWLILSSLGHPPQELDAHLDTPLVAAKYEAARALLDERVATRKPAAYLLHEAWLGRHRFYVDERVIVPRSFIAEMLEKGNRASSRRPAKRPRRPSRSSTCAPAPAASRSSPRCAIRRRAWTPPTFPATRWKSRAAT